MRGWLPHALFVLLLLARIADVGTTYFVSPNLKLEANPLAKKLRWPFAIATIAASLIAYYNEPWAVVFCIVSFMVAASNARGIWMSRALGETAYLEFLVDLAAKSKLLLALISTLLPGFLIILAGCLTFLFYRRPSQDWGWWLGFGVVFYGALDAFYRTLFMVRLFKTARKRASGVMDSTNSALG